MNRNKNKIKSTIMMNTITMKVEEVFKGSERFSIQKIAPLAKLLSTRALPVERCLRQCFLVSSKMRGQKKAPGCDLLLVGPPYATFCSSYYVLHLSGSKCRLETSSC